MVKKNILSILVAVTAIKLREKAEGVMREGKQI